MSHPDRESRSAVIKFLGAHFRFAMAFESKNSTDQYATGRGATP